MIKYLSANYGIDGSVKYTHSIEERDKLLKSGQWFDNPIDSKTALKKEMKKIQTEIEKSKKK